MNLLQKNFEDTFFYHGINIGVSSETTFQEKSSECSFYMWNDFHQQFLMATQKTQRKIENMLNFFPYENQRSFCVQTNFSTNLLFMGTILP